VSGKPVPRLFDLRLDVDLADPWPALERFLAEVSELAEAHPGIRPLSITERRAPLVHQPPRRREGARP